MSPGILFLHPLHQYLPNLSHSCQNGEISICLFFKHRWGAGITGVPVLHLALLRIEFSNPYVNTSLQKHLSPTQPNSFSSLCYTPHKIPSNTAHLHSAPSIPGSQCSLDYFPSSNLVDSSAFHVLKHWCFTNASFDLHFSHVFARPDTCSMLCSFKKSM